MWISQVAGFRLSICEQDYIKSFPKMFEGEDFGTRNCELDFGVN